MERHLFTQSLALPQYLLLKTSEMKSFMIRHWGRRYVRSNPRLHRLRDRLALVVKRLGCLASLYTSPVLKVRLHTSPVLKVRLHHQERLLETGSTPLHPSLLAR